MVSGFTKFTMRQMAALLQELNLNIPLIDIKLKKRKPAENGEAGHRLLQKEKAEYLV